MYLVRFDDGSTTLLFPEEIEIFVTTDGGYGSAAAERTVPSFSLAKPVDLDATDELVKHVGILTRLRPDSLMRNSAFL
jgi:hypothetical protein